MDISEIGEVIKVRRTLLRLTQEDLSEMSAISIRTIHQIENGSANPSMRRWIDCFKCLDLIFQWELKDRTNAKGSSIL
jgi:transcriptional regulator with XRE-family HTH domain